MLDLEADNQYYNPDQDHKERRSIRHNYRTLNRELADNKNEYMQKDSDGFLHIFNRANKTFENVKQTSDATLDSRLLVNTADAVFGKVKALDLGKDISGGVDIDEFVGKLIEFMKTSPDVLGSSGRRRRRGGGGGDSDEEEDDDDGDAGDAYDWAYLGRTAAFKSTKRPATSDFLLGPLSVQKRLRTIKARSQLKRNAANIVRPQELQLEQIEKQENTTTRLVQQVAKILERYVAEQTQLSGADGVEYFRFVVNPESFGQTVENIFYVSFLVRDGRAAMWEDEETGTPMLAISAQVDNEEEARNVVKNQVITRIDMWAWKQLVELLELKVPIIPTRPPDQALAVGGNGWYG
ncbi:Nse4 C-terminal-domain-containing protein [Peziza echinospora]|nr:Nse4 C-terminal-domain-containing protein [Peziza echinospora]